MPASPSASVETTELLPRRSRRIWQFAIVGIVVLTIGWLCTVAYDNRYRSQQAAKYNDRMTPPPMATGVGQTFANNPQVSSNHNYTTPTQLPLAQNAFQNRLPTTTYYATPYNPSQFEPQDPTEISASNEINQLRTQLRSASGDQKKNLQKSLTESVGKLFDLRHAAQSKQVEKLESELAEAKELLKKRGERKVEIVDRRISELLQSTDDLAWNREIASKQNPASTYAIPNAQPNLPSTYGLAPQSGSYAPTPNSALQTPNYVPQTPFANPILPPSSTPPQFIPLNTQGTGQTTLLNSTRDIIGSADTATVDSLAAGEPITSDGNVKQTKSRVLAMIYCEPIEKGAEPKTKGFFPIDADGVLLASSDFDASDVRKYFLVYAEGVVPPTDSEMPFRDERIKQVLPLLRELEPHRNKLKLESILIENQIKIKTSDQRNIDWGHAPGHETPGEPTTLEKLNMLLEWSVTSATHIDLSVPIERTNPAPTPELGSTQPSSNSIPDKTSDSKAVTTSSTSSKAVIEAAYAYEEALDVAIESKQLYAKGDLPTRELPNIKRNAARAKAIWTSVCRELESRKDILQIEIAGKNTLMHEIATKEKRTETLTEIATLKADFKSLTETLTWVENFQKQSIDVLEKQLAQSEENRTDEKLPDVRQ